MHFAKSWSCFDVTCSRKRTHTYPAKLVLASLASHVVAALVLFYSTDALGARLCIGQDPIRGFRLVAALFVPFG